MKSLIEKYIRKFVNFWGYEIVKLKYVPAQKNAHKWLEELHIDEIIDIGANKGWATLRFSKVLPGKKIYAIEPIKHCYDELVKSTKHLNVEHFHCGIGAEDGVQIINISKNLVSSSILPMEDLHKKLYSDSVYTDSEEIQVRRLDTLMKDRIDNSKRILIKIDVQGYEDKVIAGGTHTLTNASCIIIETSFSRLYKDQWLFQDVHTFFTANGFVFLGMYDQALSKENGAPLYCDAIFVRKELAATLY